MAHSKHTIAPLGPYGRRSLVLLQYPQTISIVLTFWMVAVFPAVAVLSSVSVTPAVALVRLLAAGAVSPACRRSKVAAAAYPTSSCRSVLPVAIGTTEVRLKRLTKHRFRSRRPSRRSLLVSGRENLWNPPWLLRQRDALLNRWANLSTGVKVCQHVTSQ